MTVLLIVEKGDAHSQNSNMGNCACATSMAPLVGGSPSSWYLDVRLGGPPKCRSPTRYRNLGLESILYDAERFTFARDAEKIHFERGAGCDGYASGGVPVTGALPDFGQSRSAGLRPPKWHFTGTRPARHDPRTIS